MSISQPNYLLTMINNFTISNSHQVVTGASYALPSIPTKYTPVFAISTVAYMVRQLIGTEILPDFKQSSIDTTSFSWRISQSNLSIKAPLVYLLVQMCLLESVAHIYALDTDTSLISYIHKQDLQNIRTNLKYLADYFGTFTSEENLFHFSSTNEAVDLGTFGYQDLQSALVPYDPNGQVANVPYDNYFPFILDVRDLEVTFGYINSQVDILQGNIITSLQ